IKLEKLAGKPIDLLPHVDLAADLINGQWKLQNGVIVTDGTAFGRLQLPYIPSEEYDFNVDLTVLLPRRNIALICSKSGRQFIWKMGAAGNKVNCFETIGGNANNTAANPTAKTYDKVFAVNQRCKVTVQVRNTFVAAYVDGVLVSRHATLNCNDMSLFPS